MSTFEETIVVSMGSGVLVVDEPNLVHKVMIAHFVVIGMQRLRIPLPCSRQQMRLHNYYFEK